MAPSHEAHMRRALELAERGWGRVSPNPMVGAVVVSGGSVVRARSMSSKPTTRTSCGTRRPRSRSTRSAAEAMRSEATKIASTSGWSSSSCPVAAVALSTVKSAKRTGHGGRPAAARPWCHPARRSTGAPMSRGPEIAAGCWAPRARRCSAARRPPLTLSTSMYVTGVSTGDQGRPMNTEGIVEPLSSSATLSVRWWDTTMAPSACCPRR